MTVDVIDVSQKRSVRGNVNELLKISTNLV